MTKKKWPWLIAGLVGVRGRRGVVGALRAGVPVRRLSIDHHRQSDHADRPRGHAGREDGRPALLVCQRTERDHGACNVERCRHGQHRPALGGDRRRLAVRSPRVRPLDKHEYRRRRRVPAHPGRHRRVRLAGRAGRLGDPSAATVLLGSRPGPETPAAPAERLPFVDRAHWPGVSAGRLPPTTSGRPDSWSHAEADRLALANQTAKRSLGRVGARLGCDKLVYARAVLAPLDSRNRRTAAFAKRVRLSRPGSAGIGKTPARRRRLMVDSEHRNTRASSLRVSTSGRASRRARASFVMNETYRLRAARHRVLVFTALPVPDRLRVDSARRLASDSVEIRRLPGLVVALHHEGPQPRTTTSASEASSESTCTGRRRTVASSDATMTRCAGRQGPLITTAEAEDPFDTIVLGRAPASRARCWRPTAASSGRSTGCARA